MDELVTLINTELDRRGWTLSELARRAGLSRSTFHATLTGKNAVTFEFCAAVAEAINVPPEQVFRLAGLLPPVADGETVSQITYLARQLDQDKLMVLREFAEYLYGKR
jgi:transcriptional regulator with XRE-family HTH domain